MFKQAFALGTALCLTSAAFAAPASSTKRAAKAPAKTAKPAKITDINFCPMTGEAAKGSGGQVVGDKRLHFCCGGCQPDFNKLSKAEQAKKIAEVTKKQQDEAKKPAAKP